MLIFVATKQARPCRCRGPRPRRHDREGRQGRFGCVTLDLLLEDGDGINVLKVIAGARLAGPNVVISGMDCRAS